MLNDEMNEKPLQGWKEIAAYLERDMRTAIRWEKDHSLPIHRHGGAKGASVYAYPSEIEEWRTARPIQAKEQPPALWRQPQVWVVGAAMAIIIAVVAYGPILNPNAPLAEAAEGSMRNEQVWTDYDYSRLSPDGKFLIYRHEPTADLWLRDVAIGKDRPISHKAQDDPSSVETSALSPSGKLFAAAWYSDRIKNYELRVGAVPLPGHTEDGRPVFECETGVSCYVQVHGWLSESRVLFAQANGAIEHRLLMFNAADGSTTLLKTFQWNAPGEIAISPDGRWIAYAVLPSSQERQHDIHILAADGSRESTLIEHPADDLSVAWSPDGSQLLFRTSRTGGQSLWALPMSEGKPLGPSKLVSSEFGSLGSIGLSPQGDLYYAKRIGSRDVYEAKFAPESGKSLDAPVAIDEGFVGVNRDPVYSPDGRFIAYLSNRSLLAFSSAYENIIVVRDLKTGKETTISPLVKRVLELSWTPDSAKVLFRALDQGSGWGIYSVPPSGGREERLFIMSRAGSIPFNLGPVGAKNALHYRDRYGHWVHDIGSGEELRIWPREAGSGSRKGIESWAHGISFAPDGARFCVMEDEGYETALYRIDLEGNRRQEIVRFADPGPNVYSPTFNSWTPDGEDILYWRGADERGSASQGYELWIVSASGGEPRKTGIKADQASWISVHPAGNRIAFSSGEPKLEIWKLSNFLDKLEPTE